jgi:hypothetical protein
METIQCMTLDGSPLLSWLSMGRKRQTLLSQRSQSAFPGGNLPSTTTIRQDVPEVKLCHRQIQITDRPSMMHGSASPRTALRGNMGVIEMTSATSLKIGGTSGSEHQPHHDGL